MADDHSERGAILVIDGDPHLRDALARLLEGEGHEVLQAADGPSAVALTKERRPDLLLLDAMTASGAPVLRAVRAELAHATPPALLLTSDGELPPHDMSAVHSLEKPFNVPELLSAVEQYLAEVRSRAS